MRWANRQRAVKLAVGSVVVGLSSMGCDGKEADVKAVQAMQKGDYVAAAQEKQASPAIAAIASGLAADQSLAKSVAFGEKLANSDIAATDALWSLSRLATQSSAIASSAVALAKYNPQQSLASIDAIVAQMKGDAQVRGPVDGALSLPDVVAITKSVNQLKDQITEDERTIASLMKQRDTANAQAGQALEESRSAKGEQQLAAIRKVADARKQATELQAQLDKESNEVAMLEQQLAVVEAQLQLASQSVESFSGLRENIEKSWRGIASQSDQRLAAAAGIFGKAGDKSGTVVSQANRVAEIFGDQEKQAAEYEGELQNASSFAKSAVTNAEKAVRESGLPKTSAKGPSPASALAEAMDPSLERFIQAHADYLLGSANGSQSLMLSNRAVAAGLVADAARQLNQKLPDGFDLDTITKARDVAGAKARESLESAEKTFETVSLAPQAAASVKRAATIGQMNTYHAMAMIAPDAATAKGNLDSARTFRDKAMESGEKVPSLPPSLQGGMPASPAGGVER